MEPAEGFEPPTRCLQSSRSTTELRRHARLIIFISRQSNALFNRVFKMVALSGVEPETPESKSGALPLC